jgi:hypothetical protein
VVPFSPIICNTFNFIFQYFYDKVFIIIIISSSSIIIIIIIIIIMGVRDGAVG